LTEATEARVTGRLLAHIKLESERLAPLAAKSREDLKAAREQLAALKAEMLGQAPAAKTPANGRQTVHAN
jgi:predicted  nucleic acid-binding Zn-ribbon protein